MRNIYCRLSLLRAPAFCPQLCLNGLYHIEWKRVAVASSLVESGARLSFMSGYRRGELMSISVKIPRCFNLASIAYCFSYWSYEVEYKDGRFAMSSQVTALSHHSYETSIKNPSCTCAIFKHIHHQLNYLHIISLIFTLRLTSPSSSLPLQSSPSQP